MTAPGRDDVVVWFKNKHSDLPWLLSACVCDGEHVKLVMAAPETRAGSYGILKDVTRLSGPWGDCKVSRFQQSTFIFDISECGKEMTVLVTGAISLNAHSEVPHEWITEWMINLIHLVIQGLFLMLCLMPVAVPVLSFLLFPISLHASLWEQSVRYYSGTQVPAHYELSWKISTNSMNVNPTMAS